MKNTKKYIKLTCIIAVFALVVGIGIVYAALSQELNINGTADVQSASFVIKFADLQAVKKTGNANEVTAPEIKNDTKIEEYAVTLSTPGDSIVYEFKVVNSGTIDAELSSITVPTPQCGDGTSQDDINVCKNLIYKLTYTDGTAIQTSDVLTAGQSKDLKLTLEYKKDVANSELPNDDVNISNLSIVLNYIQH